MKIYTKFLYIVTFDTPHTYIKTFISDEKPAKIYNDHKIVYDSIKQITQKTVNNNIRVYYIPNVDEMYFKSTICNFDSKMTKDSLLFCEYDHDIKLIEELIQSYIKTKTIVEKINGKCSTCDIIPELKEYTTTDISDYNPTSNDSRYSLDVSFVQNNENKITLDISKKNKDEIKTVTIPNTDDVIVEDKFNITKEDDIQTWQSPLTDRICVLSSAEITSGWYEPDVSNESEKERFSETYKSYIARRELSQNQPMDTQDDVEPAEDIYLFRRKRHLLDLNLYQEVPNYSELEKRTGTNLAICKSSIDETICVLLTDKEAIEIVKNNEYMPEFIILESYVTPETEEYYDSLVIKLKNIIKNGTIIDDIITGGFMYGIFNSVNIFLGHTDYNFYLLTKSGYSGTVKSQTDKLSSQNASLISHTQDKTMINIPKRNSNLQLRSDFPNPKEAVSPWMQSTITNFPTPLINNEQ